MAHFLFQGRYSATAVKAMVATPQDREAAARALIEGLGGKLHAFYFTFGEYDFMAIIEANKISMAAGSMAVGAGGAITGAVTTALMTSDEAQEAMTMAGKAVATYSAPA